MADVVTKILAESIAMSVRQRVDELDRAREDLEVAQARVVAQEKKLDERLAWFARIVEGIPMEKVNAADKVTEPEGKEHG